MAVTVEEGGRAAVDVVRALDAEGLAPESLAVREPTLDDVFLQLTGRGVTPEPGAGARKRGAA